MIHLITLPLVLLAITSSPAHARLLGKPFGSKDPANAELKTAVAAVSETLPTYITMGDFSVDTADNYGAKVEPEWVARFSLTATTREALYVEDNTEQDITFISQKNHAYSAIDLYGKITTVIFQGKMNHWVVIDDSTLAHIGMPLSYVPGRTIIRNSIDEKKYLAEQQAQIDRRRENERRVTEEKRRQEEQRQQALANQREEERKRAEPEETWKRQAHQQNIARAEETTLHHFSDFCVELLRSCTGDRNALHCIVLRANDNNFKIKTATIPCAQESAQHNLACMISHARQQCEPTEELLILQKSGISVANNFSPSGASPPGCIGYLTDITNHANKYGSRRLQRFSGPDYFVNQQLCSEDGASYPISVNKQNPLIPLRAVTGIQPFRPPHAVAAGKRILDTSNNEIRRNL